MTEQGIDRLEAGRVLDLLLTEKVMDLFAPYSTKIEHAWRVVEKLDLLSNAKLFKDGELWVIGRNEWTIRETSAETASLVICRAALKSLL